jgi:hypothetical protein
MITHAILITYRDLEQQNTELINKAIKKYGDRFKQLYFDSGLLVRYLILEVREIPQTDRLKIYISGHGGTGIQYITANDRIRKQTVEDLAIVLAYGLAERHTSPQTSANTEVNMFSCFFGRTPDGGLDGCPAVRLHKMLAAKRVYVDLVARTEWLAAKPSGRVTMSPRHLYIDGLKYRKHLEDAEREEIDTLQEWHKEQASNMKPESWKRRKTQFTKIRCTYQGHSPVVGIRDYQGEELYINSEDLPARRILWADNVINQLVEYIAPPSGQITDERHKKVYETVKLYDEKRNPELLREKMQTLIPEFSSHRAWIHKPGLPKTAALIERLLREYPRS